MFVRRSSPLRSEPACSSWRQLLWLSALHALLGCSPESVPYAPPQPAELEVAAEPEALSWREARALGVGRRELLVEGITSAENSLFSAAGRLYVSGDNGVFELVRAADTRRVSARPRVSVEGCKFGGMAERSGTLYAVCYDAMQQSHVYAARETAEPTYSRIFSLTDVFLGNGMASDRDNLYVTATGQGRILRLRMDPADPLRVSARDDVMKDPGGLMPNGIKVLDGVMYWGDFGTLRRTPLASPTPRDVRVNALTYFDDLVVTERGLLVADYLFGALRAYTLSGVAMGNTQPGVFSGPSSVQEARGRLGFAESDLIVTEKTTSTIAVFHLD